MKAQEIIESTATKEIQINNKLVDRQALLRWVQRNHAYLNYYITARKQNRAIYRGMGWNSDQDYDMNIITPGIRESTNTSNEYTMWMSNHPSWKAYPKRNKSFICSSTYSYAGEFGRTHWLIPLKDAVIGVCPEKDLWQSFWTALGEGTSANDFNHFLNEVFRDTGLLTGMFGKKHLAPYAQSYNELASLLKKCKPEGNMQAVDDFVHGTDIGDNARRIIYHHRTLYDAMVELLDPTFNGFSLTTTKELNFLKQNDSNSKEIWLSTPCLAIRVGTELDKFLMDEDRALLTPKDLEKYVGTSKPTPSPIHPFKPSTGLSDLGGAGLPSQVGGVKL